MKLTDYLGDKPFWRVTARLALPVALQNVLTSSFQLVDTMMVSRLGDVFGTTVNKAARLTAVAPSGRILVDDVLAQELVDAPGLVTVKQRSRTLRGVGVVTPSLLSPGLGDSLLA